MLHHLLMATALAQPPSVQVDLHLDTPTQLLGRGLSMESGRGLEAGLPQLRQGGTNVAVEVLWPPRKSEHRSVAYALLDKVQAQIDQSDGLELATTPARAREIVATEKVAVVISMEGAHGLGQDGKWRETFLDFYSRGLRLIGLTWSFSNRFAGSSGDAGGGLTPEGVELVAMARARGVVLDVSHASRKTTLEVCQGAPVPVIASHSDAWALTKHARNLTDEEIRCIADSGGVIGLNFHAPFVGPGADVSRVADHADHLAKVGGYSVVALGSDFDGFIKKPIGLEHAGRLPALWVELRRRGWTDAQIEGIRGENFMRAWSRVQRAAQAP